ncbi:MAG: EamA family transporter [Mogibacterium sp.]|nr:EamA family transporter [Mogibacterium sp.]
MQERKAGKSSYIMIGGAVITLAGAALWGLNAVVSKFLMARGIDTMWMVNFRMISSGFVLLLFGAFKDPMGMLEIWKDRRSVIRLLTIALLAFGVCQLTYYLSIDYSNAGIAAALQQTAPAFVLVYVVIRERRKPYPAEAVTLPLVIAGSFLIATHGDPHALAIHPLALTAGLISALCSALYITLPSPLIRRYGTLPTVGWGLFIGGIFLAPFCRLWAFPETWDMITVAGLAFIIIPGAALAFAFFLYGTSIVGPVRGGVYNLFEPVVACIASAVFLSQSFHISEVIGIISILTGIAILTVSKGTDNNKTEKGD